MIKKAQRLQLLLLLRVKSFLMQKALIDVDDE